jgi:hypothetical protein
MTIEIIKGHDNQVADFFSSPSNTPETDKKVSVGLENADRECVPAEFARKLERERDEAMEALMKIEEVFIDSDDTYEDLIKIGNIARAVVEAVK